MKRILSAILVAVLLISCLPVTAALAADTAKVEKMQVSEQLIAMIKKEEGFSAQPYWDYSQYSIGYGCAVKNKSGQRVRTEAEAEALYPNGITEAEADALLREEVRENYAAPVNNFAINRGFVFTQNQFDALVSFTYNVGSAWMQARYRVVLWLESNLGKQKLTAEEELEFVSAIGSWCRAGDSILPALCHRRINEAKMFLYGAYSGESTPRDFSYAIYHAQKSTLSNGYEDMAEYYIRGVKMGELPVPNSASGYTFTGWTLSDGSVVTSATVARSQSMLIYAQWKTGSGETVPPTTEPEPTEPAPTEPEPVELPYKDVSENSWYREAVEYAYREKLFKGTSEDTFSPNMSMDRAMLVTVLWRHAGEPEVDYVTDFTDISRGGYYYKALNWAQKYGIINGVSPTEFAPSMEITREQFATILYRYCADYWGITPENSVSLSRFDDGYRTQRYAEEAMAWAVGNGLIYGIDGMLVPRGEASRAQVATVFMRVAKNVLN